MLLRIPTFTGSCAASGFLAVLLRPMLVVTSVLVTSAIAQRPAYSTHDSVLAPVGVVPPDTWSDVKTPGNGRTYAVGTTLITSSVPAAAPTFSGTPVSGPPAPFPFVTGARQVAVLQASDTTGILWQRYFYGFTAAQPGNGLSTHARAISVFPAFTDAETRIAICGETFDNTLPGAVTPAYAGFSNLWPSGFLAVYDGAGTLLWSYQFYGQDYAANTAICDVVVRVNSTVTPAVDEVTYCGFSSNGTYTPPTAVPSTMAPLLFFAPPPNVPGCTDIYGGGDVHTAGLTTAQLNQNDGIVGRISAPHIPPVVGLPAAAAVFHSIVGGAGQDALLGITAIDNDRFAVVGVTASTSTPQTLAAIPLTRPSFTGAPLCFTSQPWNSMGVVFVFDALLTRVGLPLNLVGSTLVGNQSAGSTVRDSIARDVIWHGGLLYIVGSTTDAGFTAGFSAPFAPTLNAASDGFVVTCGPDPNVGFIHASYFRGQSTVAGLAAVAAWPEYPDHIALVGWGTEAVGRTNIVAASLFRDTTLTGPFFPLTRLKEFEIGVALLGNETPGAYEGALTTAGLWGAFTMHLPVAGGGGAVDSRGLITIAGHTRGSVDFPVSPAGAWPAGRGPQAGHGAVTQEPDGVLAVIDMLPGGVCRSDRTGSCVTAVYWPASGDGGTTPTCALLPFGLSPTGGPYLPAFPFLHRMMIDLEGVPASGSPVAVLVDRPPAGALALGVLQLGFPSWSPSTSVLPGIEVWANASTPVLLPQVVGSSLREPLWGPAGLPPGPNTFSIQFITLLSHNLCGDPTFTYAASPALAVQYN